jgi:mono/diheme cytochrome c family protein
MLEPIRNLIAALAGAAAVLAVSHAAAADNPVLVERGRYLATAGDCAACHTQAGNTPFGGGVAIASPLGTIYSTNITPSRTAGIGAYSLAQFSRALRHGVRADGSRLYPAMPYTAYAKLTDDDTAALYAFFLHGVQPDDKAAPRTSLPFPFNVRASMAVWNWLYLDTTPYQPDLRKSAEWNRGAYLAQGLAHCATCHTPRNFLMAEQSSLYLQGGSLGTWYAPDITPGKAGWNRTTLVDYLRTGHAQNGATAGGPMLEAIDKSFSKMAPQDIVAIATYLQDLPPSAAHAAAPTPAPAPVAAVAGGDVAEMAGSIGPGERLYRNNCAACHQVNGDGMRGLPALRNHPMLRHPSADNVGMAILDGVWPEEGQGMPGFANELTDREVADLTNYVMANFGGSKVGIDARRVGELRQGGATSPLLLLARAGMVVALLVALLLLWRRSVKRRRRAAQAVPPANR